MLHGFVRQLRGTLASRLAGLHDSFRVLARLAQVIVAVRVPSGKRTPRWCWHGMAGTASPRCSSMLAECWSKLACM